MAEEAGKVVVVVGDVSAESASGTRSLTIGSPVFQDDLLVTDQGERVEVLFSDGTRLSQGENSRLNIDSYVYDPNAPDDSDMLLNAVQGTYRTITGKVAEENPDNFIIKTPLATLGIRGTTVLSHITPEHEIHGPEYIEEGKAFVLTDNFGNIRFITDYKPVKVIDVYKDEPAGFQRILTEDELLFFDEQVPITPEAREGSSEGGAAGAAIVAPFGPDNDDGQTSSYLAFTPNLFGPDGLPPLGEVGVQYTYPPYLTTDPLQPLDIEPTSPYEDSDIFYGYIEDSTNHNFPPTAENLFASINEDHTLFGELRATDPEDDPLTYSAASNPQHGSVTVNPDGTYVYRPNPNYFGEDSFTYIVEDIAGNTSTAVVTIEVNPVNDPPVAEDATVTTAEDTQVTDQLQAFDVDGDPLTYSIAVDPANGNVIVNPDGTYTYTPNPGFVGTDTFFFFVSDGHGGIDQGEITVVVSAGPLPPPETGEIIVVDPMGDGDSQPGFPTDNDILTAGDDVGIQINIADVNAGQVPLSIFGFGGNDTITGRAGEDWIYGGAGNDVLTGGAGNDHFVYSYNTDGYDRIQDFATGSDSLVIHGLTGTQVITASNWGPYGGTAPGTGPAIVVYHDTAISTGSTTGYYVIYDPSVSTAGGEVYMVTTLQNQITATDVVVA